MTLTRSGALEKVVWHRGQSLNVLTLHTPLEVTTKTKACKENTGKNPDSEDNSTPQMV